MDEEPKRQIIGTTEAFELIYYSGEDGRDGDFRVEPYGMKTYIDPKKFSKELRFLAEKLEASPEENTMEKKCYTCTHHSVCVFAKNLDKALDKFLATEANHFDWRQALAVYCPYYQKVKHNEDEIQDT